MKKQSPIQIVSVLGSVLLIVVIGIVALSFKSTPHSDSQKLQIVAAENFWGNIAAQIGGDKANVTSVISKPGADPHLYESSARDALSLVKADIVITNGLGYDDFMDRLLSASHNDSRKVISVARTLGVSGKNTNPHLWYDIPKVGTVAEEFEKAMAAKDPKNAPVYSVNLAKFKMSLQPVLAVLRQIKTTYAGAPVAYTERVPEYLLAAAGLTSKTPAGFSSAIEEGSDPSPADSTAMNTLITSRSVRVLIYNAQATSSVTEHVKRLANDADIPVVGVTETLPSDEPTYQSWQLHQAQALLKALEEK